MGKKFALDMFGIPFPRFRVDVHAVNAVDDKETAKCIFCEQWFRIAASNKAKGLPVVCRFCETEILGGRKPGIGMTMTPEGVRRASDIRKIPAVGKPRRKTRKPY